MQLEMLGRVDYLPTYQAMQAFTEGRGEDTPDELWLCEHTPVFTQGLAGKPDHLLAPGDIPVVQTNRGGQVTYHGPGQVVAYVLLDMKRSGLTVRPLVRRLERAVIDLLEEYGIAATGRVDAPGVYVGEAKIAALGLRVTRGCCYHGLALNADMDLSPFHAIDPCGYPGLASTRMADHGVGDKISVVQERFERSLLRCLTT